MQDIDWHFASPCPALEDGSWQDQATRVKHNRKRDVYRTDSLFVKANRQTAWKDKLKKIVRCKALEEFNALQALSEAGITAVRPVAWGKSADSTYLATEAWLPSEMVDDVLRKPGEGFFADLARFLCLMRSKGVLHPDMHGGNLLCRPAGDGYEFCTVDTIGVRVRPTLSTEEADQLFLWVAPILAESASALDAFVAQGANQELEPNAWLARLMREVERRAMLRLPGKVRRFGEDGRVCKEHSDASGSWLIRSEEDTDAITAAVATFANFPRDAPEYVKLGSKRVVARIGRYIVKKYLGQDWRPAWLRRDRSAWFNSARFETMGFPSARGLAWVRQGPQSGIVVYEDVGQDCLHDLLQTPDCELRKHWLTETAELMASLHLAEVFHADLKTSNHIHSPATDGPGRITLIDCDTASFGKALSLEKRVRNLASLIETVPDTVEPAEIAEFLTVYCGKTGTPESDLRELLSKQVSLP